ncbi:MAG: ATP-binding cassette domain-containing protein [Ignavibacteriota bacterium]
MPEPQIRVQSLSKVYQSGGADLVVFSGVDLEVARGEMVALVGESGAGKSTLLHLLGGLDRLPAVRYTTEVQKSQPFRTRSKQIFATGKLGSFGRFTTCCRNLRPRKT